MKPNPSIYFDRFRNTCLVVFEKKGFLLLNLSLQNLCIAECGINFSLVENPSLNWNSFQLFVYKLYSAFISKSSWRFYSAFVKFHPPPLARRTSSSVQMLLEAEKNISVSSYDKSWNLLVRKICLLYTSNGPFNRLQTDCMRVTYMLLKIPLYGFSPRYILVLLFVNCCAQFFLRRVFRLRWRRKGENSFSFSLLAVTRIRCWNFRRLLRP